MIKIISVMMALLLLSNQLYAAKNSSIIQDTNDEDFKALKLKRPRPDYSLNEDDDLLEKNLTLKIVDENMGVILGDYHTKNDSSRMSFLYHVNADLKSMFEIRSFEFIYAKKYESFWWESSISLNSGKFSEISENNEVALGVTTDDILDGSGSTLSIATGVSYRTTLIQEMLKTGDYFETISALASYNMFSETQYSSSFSGLGMKADLGIHKRLAANYHLGFRASYFLASVKRASEEEGETAGDRSLMLHWVSLGADLTFYF